MTAPRTPTALADRIANLARKLDLLAADQRIDRLAARLDLPAANGTGTPATGRLQGCQTPADTRNDGGP